MITIAAKSRATNEALERTQNRIITPLKSENVSVFGHEVFLPTDYLSNEKARVALLEKFCLKNGIKKLAYHTPIIAVDKKKEWDLANPHSKLMRSCMNCLYELSEINEFVDDTYLVVHTRGLIDSYENLAKEKEEKTKFTIEAIKEIKKSSKSKICLENNFPDFEITPHNTLTMHLQELVNIVNVCDVNLCLDFAHFEIFFEYLKNGKGESPIADLDKKTYGDLDWKKAVELVKPKLRMAHINDAKSYTSKYEGIDVGTGNVPFEQIIPELAKNDVLGTFEIVDLHLRPEGMIKSINYLKKMFGDKFYKYFQS